MVVLLLPLTVQFLHSLDSHDHKLTLTNADHLHDADLCCDLCKVIPNLYFLSPDPLMSDLIDFEHYYSVNTESTVQFSSNTSLLKNLRAPPALV